MSRPRGVLVRWVAPGIILVLLVIAGAAVLAREPANTPGPGADTGNSEGDVIRSPLQIESIAIRIAESDPPQYFVDVHGIIPDSCTEALEPTVTQKGDTFKIEILGERPKDLMCAQVIKEYRTSIALGTPDPGTYTVDVNGVTTTLKVDY